MRNRILSLFMCAAMVVSASVSVYADSADNNVSAGGTVDKTVSVIDVPSDGLNTSGGGSKGAGKSISGSGGSNAGGGNSSVTGKTNEKVTPIVTVDAINVQYTGVKLSDGDIKGTAIDNTNKVSGKWSFKDKSKSIVNVADSGSYDVVFTPDDTTKYNEAGAKVAVSIKKSPLTVKADNVTREYGTSNPPVTVKYDGFKNGETKDVLGGKLEYSYGGVSDETKAGVYPGAVAISGLESVNYDITYVFGDLTITKLPAQITVDKAIRKYIQISFDKEIAGLTKSNFAVKDGENAVDFTDVIAVGNTTYRLTGLYDVDKTYTVTVNLNGNDANGVYELKNPSVSAKTVRVKSGSSNSISGKVITYTVKFDTNGGDAIKSVKVTRGATLEKPETPKKDGFDFDGWYSDRQLTKKYDFAQKVTSDITLYAAWSKREIEPDQPDSPIRDDDKKDDVWINPYIDVTNGDWFKEAVEYAVKNKLMNGTSKNTFEPEQPLTRAMLVTVLWRAEDKPYVNYIMPFDDVNADEYYSEAVRWAASTGIVTGASEREFEPDANITREQFATMVFRYAQYKKYNVSVWENTNILSYADAESVSEYAIPAMQYVVGAHLMNGKTVSTLNPRDNATRAEIAAIMQRTEWYK